MGWFKEENTGTKIGFFMYDGGEGVGNKDITIGICREDITTVYNLLKDKFIISRCEVAPKGELDFSYGLTIDRFEPVDIYGLTHVVTGELEKLIGMINKFSKDHNDIKKKEVVKKVECFKPETLLNCICCFDEKGGCNSKLLKDTIENKNFDECIKNFRDCDSCKSQAGCKLLKKMFNK